MNGNAQKIDTSLLASAALRADIFRILRFEHLAAWFESGRIPLLSPSKWEDPFERAVMNAVLDKKGARDSVRARMYGLCLSKNGISDALWRIYSPTQNGIRIRLPVITLIDALSRSPELLGGKTFVGAVNYVSTAEWSKQMGQVKSNMDQHGDAAAIAKMMLLKRTPFKHEDEIRIIHLKAHADDDELLHITLDPHEVIKTILIDPRASQLQFMAFKKFFSDTCRFGGSISQSSLYRPPSF